MFLLLLDKVQWNSFLIYRNVVRKRITFFEFQIQAVEELLHKYVDAASGKNNPGRPPTVDNTTRHIKRRFTCHISPTPAKDQSTRRCKVCW
ncbi:hypothetical protein TNCV_2293671 [Trichonephila clavipes]|nr:hypothetical protein TNCV_2293671 [Trichonephila clavipes]